MEYIIQAKGLVKTYKIFKSGKTGLATSLRSLFHRDYNYVNAVDGIDLQIKKGAIHALIGVNGSGKSTIVKMLSGVLYPTAGDATVMGYTPWNDRVTYVRHIGVLFGQKTQLTWDLPAIDTFLMLQKVYDVPPVQFQKRLNDMVETFKIGEIIRKPVRNLSLGERMKCELVCALIHQPKLVFLDEPTIGLDLLSKASLIKFITKMNREEGITFILTSHDMSDIESLCESVTIIHQGKIIYNGDITRLKAKFSGKKIIKVKFKESVSREMVNGYPFIFSDPLNAMMEVTMADMAGIQNEFFKLMEQLPVLDIEIQTPDMESVVRTIFESKMS